VEPNPQADRCENPPLEPPTAACGAGDNNGADNGWCGGDGRVYYCYQTVWHLKEDCVAEHLGCIKEPNPQADKCG
jgi:hypothetical protein